MVEYFRSDESNFESRLLFQTCVEEEEEGDGGDGV
jgi:hypothetical protein